MNNSIIYLLDGEKWPFMSLIRSFFAAILRFVYNWIERFIDIMYSIAQDPTNLGLDNYVQDIGERISYVLIIFMVFRTSISLMSYLVDPDSFNDNSKGVQGFIKRVIVSIVLLISINPIFSIMRDIQNIIIDDDIISNIVMKDTTWKTADGDSIYLTKMSPFCEKLETGNSKYRVVTFSPGDHLALLTLRPFIQPVNDEEGDLESRKEDLQNLGYCGIDISQTTTYIDTTKYAFSKSFGGLNSASGYLQWNIYNGYTGEWSVERNVYLIDFNFLMALVIGVVVLLLVLTFCFDVVIRSFTLFLLQIIAPISIISYMNPKGKSSEMLGIWAKKVGSTWASLFIKILAIDLALAFITIICESDMLNNGQGMLTSLIIIIGALMFAKKLPKLIEELIPGVKFDGMELNPFKRISKDALGGNALLGTGALLGAAGLAGLTNGIQRGSELFKSEDVAVPDGQGGMRWKRRSAFRDEDGNLSFRSSARNIARIGGRTAGSAIAGATRAGVNAFGRANKDGNMFGGMWNGYQTAMYSKLLREENRRKGGTAAGAIAADIHRWTGTLTAGQVEQIEAERIDAELSRHEEIVRKEKEALAAEKRQLAQEKHDKLEPFQQYSSYAQRIKDRISNDKRVKDAQKALDDAQATGDENKIKLARQKLDLAESLTGQNLMLNDDEVKHYISKMDELRRNNAELNASKYNYAEKDANGNIISGFKSGSIYETQHQSNIIEDRYKEKESEFTVRERQIETYQATYIDRVKNSETYKVLHDKDSPAKVDNSTQMNREPQKPGQTFSYGQPPQSTFAQQSFFGGGPGPMGPGGGPPPPPPSGGPGGNP